MKVGKIYRNNLGTYVIVAEIKIFNGKTKFITENFGGHLLKTNKLKVGELSADNALERIMDLCGLNYESKFVIRSQIDTFTNLTRHIHQSNKEE